MEIVPKKVECDVVTVKDIEPGESFKVVNDDEHVYVKAIINTGGYDALCLNDGNLYRDLVADVVKVNGAFVEDYDNVVSKNKLITNLDTLSDAQADEICKLEQEIDELNDELRETKNILEHTRNIQRQTAKDNDKLREYLREKDNIINSLRTELKDLQAALHFKSDGEELTVVAAVRAAERIKQLTRDNEALMFQLQKERETSDTTNNAVIEQQSVQLQDAYRLLEQIANIVYDNEFHCSGQAILNNPERLLSKLKKLMTEYDTKIGKIPLVGLNALFDFTDELVKRINDILAPIDRKLSDWDITTVESLLRMVVSVAVDNKKLNNSRYLTTATRERILTDIANEGITFKPANDSVDVLVSELTYAYIADHVTCRKILEQCRAFSESILRYEEPVLDYSDTDEENDNFDEPTD